MILEGCRVVRYRRLIVCPGLKLDWHAIEGLPETLGRNGVTSNYRYDRAPYTWQLVLGLHRGRALFTQPSTPLNCAGAPQNAMYLSSDYWRRSGRLKHIDVQMFHAGAALFDMPDYVPALMEYVQRYPIGLNFGFNLYEINGRNKFACFKRTLENGTEEVALRQFDMIHVVPPQKHLTSFAPVRLLTGKAGLMSIRRRCATRLTRTFSQSATSPTLRKPQSPHASRPTSSLTMCSRASGRQGEALYDGYSSCPFTVARGKIVLAEFLYGGKVTPTMPPWLADGKRPSRLAWLLNEHVWPRAYWRAMFKGRERLAGVRPMRASRR